MGRGLFVAQPIKCVDLGLVSLLVIVTFCKQALLDAPEIRKFYECHQIICILACAAWIHDTDARSRSSTRHFLVHSRDVMVVHCRMENTSNPVMSDSSFLSCPQTKKAGM